MTFSSNALPTILLAFGLITLSTSFSVVNVVPPRMITSSSSSLKSSLVSEFISKQYNSTSSYDFETASQIESFFENESLDTLLDDLVGKSMSNDNAVTSSQPTKKTSAAANNNKTKKRNNYKNKSKNKSKKRHNYSDLESMLKEQPDLKLFKLHSSAVTHLHLRMPINDITRAIKRAQNRHDAHDLKTIGAFLIDECGKESNKNWGYGYRGTLLSRLAVAALHVNEVELALRAIDARRVHERPSMKPYESAAITRGLLRAGLKEDGWSVLEDELRLPMDGTDLSDKDSQEVIKYRAHALSSIATRYFYHNKPQESITALKKLNLLGTVVAQSHIAFEDLNMPWMRLEDAASKCNQLQGQESKDGGQDLREHVWNVMSYFPCPNDEDEECSIDSYLMP